MMIGQSDTHPIFFIVIMLLPIVLLYAEPHRVKTGFLHM